MTARQMTRVNLLRDLASRMGEGPEKEALLHRANAILAAHAPDPRIKRAYGRYEAPEFFSVYA